MASNSAQPRRKAPPHGLLIVNGLLLAALATLSLAPLAGAQVDRRRAEYSIASGTIKGTDAAAVWIVDGANQELIAVVWNANAGQIEGIGYRDLSSDGAALLRGGGGRN